MKTIKQIQEICELKKRQTVYYRIKKSGIEEKEGYEPQYTFINGKPVRCFPEDEAQQIINIKNRKNECEK